MEYMGTAADNTTPVVKALAKAEKRKLKQLYKMVKYLHQKNKSTNWMSLKEEDLDTFLWEIIFIISGINLFRYFKVLCENFYLIVCRHVGPKLNFFFTKYI